MMMNDELIVVEFPAEGSLSLLRKKVEQIQTARPFKIWHDHSSLNGHSTFLISVTFLYDPAVYYTAEELNM